MKKKYLSLLVVVLMTSVGFGQVKTFKQVMEKKKAEIQPKKVVVYQVFTRLFGNQNQTNKPWGTIKENGVGKFNDFTDKALSEIKKLGVTHIWYTGVPHHAVINDYTKYGISNDDPDVVKGRAGSPYAVKDYYNVNPDLAVDPAKRLQEFDSLIKRTHKNGLKLIIDIVPNHIARNYKGLSNPKGVKDFGADDNTSVEYARDNNFYYIPGQAFQVPTDDNYKPLNGENIDTNFIGYDEYFSFCIPITNSSNFELTTGEGGDIASFTNKVNGIELLSEILTTLTEIKTTLDIIKTAPKIIWNLTTPQSPVTGNIKQEDYTIDSNITNLEKNIENITKFINSGD
jgi:hypothetical protein